MINATSLLLKTASLATGLVMIVSGPVVSGELDPSPAPEAATQAIQNNLSSASGTWSRASGISLLDLDRRGSTELQETESFIGIPADLENEKLFESLNSSPDARITFYLDFNGGVLEKTHWNARAGKDSIEVKPFSLDGDNQSLSAQEKATIYSVWAKVAATFAQFDVNVTTAAPAAEDIKRSSAADERFGIHVMFTEHDLPIGEDCDCNGIAAKDAVLKIGEKHVPSPAFVNPIFFTSENNYSPTAHDFRSLDDASFVLFHIAVHEIGHALGLEHDGIGDHTEYADPIGALSFFMGATALDFRGMARWSDGTHMGVFGQQGKGLKVNYEDDIAILESVLPVREDDFSDEPTSMVDSWKVPLNSVSTMRGILTNHEDVDWVRITVSQDSIARIRVSPTVHNHQLGAGLKILNSEGSVPLGMPSKTNEFFLTQNQFKSGSIFDWNRKNASSEAIVLLPAGDYYISAHADTGAPLGRMKFSNYGSLGPWNLEVEPLTYDEEYNSGRFGFAEVFNERKAQLSR